MIAEGEGDDDQQEIVENFYKGSVLNPGAIGGDGNKKEIAPPNAKVGVKVGEKYVPKSQQTSQETKGESKNDKKPSKHQIWSEE